VAPDDHGGHSLRGLLDVDFVTKLWHVRGDRYRLVPAQLQARTELDRMS
jgi:hypothetical protein